MSIAAYKRTIVDTESPRQIERRVLSQATAALERQYQAFDEAESRFEKLQLLADGLREALWRNQQIWSALKSDLTENGNTLSPDLRASLISLAIWVDNHTISVLHGSKTIKPLLEVNHSVIRGLDGNKLHFAE